jgi:6-phosphofructokinase 1
VKDRKKLAILVGGGPAPGINGVISAATVRARQHGLEVLGVRNGYKHLVRREADQVVPLDEDAVYRIHLRGGSRLGTSRENPTKSEERMAAVVETLEGLGVGYLVSIGGDDTALSARYVTEHSEGRIHTAHVPKTIDNDLPLPPHIPTFGYETAREVGTRLVRNLMIDSKTTKRFYLVVAMGRKAGHLALGIGKSSGATNTLIAEEFPDSGVPFSTLADHIEATIIKRRAMGKPYGVIVLAEGLIGKLDASEIEDLQDVELDEHGHVRFAEVDLGRKLKNEVIERLRERSIEVTIVSKNIGYELRCAAPTPLDMEYTRDLGYAAVEFLMDGGSGAMVTLQGGELVPLGFDDMKDPETGKTRVRYADVTAEGYEVARSYMIRLSHGDLEDATTLERLARAGGLPEAEIKRRFQHIAAAAPGKQF